MSQQIHPSAAVVTAANTPDQSYADWPSILIGAVLASGITLVFSSFGLGLGLTMIAPYQGDGSAMAELLSIGSWILWTTISSVMAGAYVTGRMRRRVTGASPDEASVRDGVHGLAVWGVTMLLGALVLGGTAETALNTAIDIATPVTGADQDSPSGAAGDADALAEIARKYAVISAFVLAAAQLIAAAGAYWAAGIGGQHRDEQRVFVRFGRWT